MTLKPGLQNKKFIRKSKWALPHMFDSGDVQSGMDPPGRGQSKSRFDDHGDVGPMKGGATFLDSIFGRNRPDPPLRGVVRGRSVAPGGALCSVCPLDCVWNTEERLEETADVFPEIRGEFRSPFRQTVSLRNEMSSFGKMI